MRGVGPATKERLGWAGIRSAEDLARVRDLSVVAEWTGIAPARLATLVEEAMKATAPRPTHESLQAIVGSAQRLLETLSRSLTSLVRRST